MDRAGLNYFSLFWRNCRIAKVVKFLSLFFFQIYVSFFHKSIPSQEIFVSWKHHAHFKVELIFSFETFPFSKGQIKPKADWRAIDSPKKWTNKFVLLAVNSKKQKSKKKLFVRSVFFLVFFWKNLRPTNLLYLTFRFKNR